MAQDSDFRWRRIYIYVGNADGLDFDRKCVRLLGCTGRRCICCNNAPEILKCYDTQAACMAHCTNPTI
ncbi:hypothetical protein Bca4012_077138 [Brassica carinata]